jgi:hypothetical protein
MHTANHINCQAGLLTPNNRKTESKIHSASIEQHHTYALLALHDKAFTSCGVVIAYMRWAEPPAKKCHGLPAASRRCFKVCTACTALWARAQNHPLHCRPQLVAMAQPCTPCMRQAVQHAYQPHSTHAAARRCSRVCTACAALCPSVRHHDGTAPHCRPQLVAMAQPCAPCTRRAVQHVSQPRSTLAAACRCFRVCTACATWQRKCVTPWRHCNTRALKASARCRGPALCPLHASTCAACVSTSL